MMLNKAVRSCSGTELTSRFGTVIADLAIDSVASISADLGNGLREVDIKEYIKTEKIPGGQLEDSKVLKGVMFNKDVVSPRKMRRKILNPRIVLLDSPLGYKEGENQTDAELMKEEHWATLLGTEKHIEQLCVGIIKLKPDLVITEKGLSELASHYLSKAGVSAIGRLRKTDNNRIARACGATIVNSPEEIQESDVGTGCGLFEVKKIGDQYFSFIVKCKEPKVCTVLLRGPSKDLLNEVERSLADAMGVVRTIIEDAKVVLGGGTSKIAIAATLKKKSMSIEDAEEGSCSRPQSTPSDSCSKVWSQHTLDQNCPPKQDQLGFVQVGSCTWSTKTVANPTTTSGSPESNINLIAMPGERFSKTNELEHQNQFESDENWRVVYKQPHLQMIHLNPLEFPNESSPTPMKGKQLDNVDVDNTNLISMSKRQSRKDRISAKRRSREKAYIKATVTKQRTKEINIVKSEIKGAFVVCRNRNSENYDGEYIKCLPEKYFQIHHDTVVVSDKASKDIVLVVRCLPFAKMSRDEFMEYQEVTHTLMKMTKNTREVKSNAAQRSGTMYAVGWRGGCDGGKTMGYYAPKKRVQNSESALLEWQQQQEILLPKIVMTYKKKFNDLAPLLFEQTKMEAMQTEVPILGETEFDLLHTNKEKEAFCSNLTYTMYDFSNSFHQDNDCQTYSFGIWAPVCLQTGNLLSKNNGFQSSGGQFLLGSYKAFVDFDACDGIVEVIWRGASDFHCTLPSTSTANCTRFGSSVQISNSLVQRMGILLKMQAKGEDANRRVRGVKEIVELKLKGLKPSHK